MTLQLFKDGEPDAPSYCSESFSNSGENSKHWIGLAAVEYTPVGWHVLEYLAYRLDGSSQKNDTSIFVEDESDQSILMIKKTMFNEPSVQKEWAEIVATPLRKLVQYSDAENSVSVGETIFNEWCEMELSERVSVMLKTNLKDISMALSENDIPEEAHGIMIQRQVELILT